jgi:hypothetical protein
MVTRVNYIIYGFEFICLGDSLDGCTCQYGCTFRYSDNSGCGWTCYYDCPFNSAALVNMTALFNSAALFNTAALNNSTALLNTAAINMVISGGVSKFEQVTAAIEI